MSKKDYQAIARVLYQARKTEPAAPVFKPTAEEMRWDIAGRLATIFAADNPRFDRGRFLEACATGQTKGMRRTA